MKNAVRVAGWAAAILLLGVSEGEAAGPRSPAPKRVLHIAPDVFTERGLLGDLQLTLSAIQLADGPDRSVLKVSPGMAAVGFRDLAFTFPGFSRGYDLGIGTLELRVRIPGSDVGDRSSTLQTTRIALAVAGPSIVLTATFESDGAEFVGDYMTRTTHGNESPWTQFLDIQADNLTVTASFPLAARGAFIGIGGAEVAVDFAFSATALRSVGVNVDGTAFKEYIAATVRERVSGFLNADEYRRPLAQALSVYLINNPAFEGVIFDRLELRTAADGGLDLEAVVSSEP